ncbi:MAG TPA: hypothetical protein VGN63_08125 [Flavisolibacter sp.]|jgi:hypothetical protein|nr:hypothetical protein [Flavisolibacter sp.]
MENNNDKRLDIPAEANREKHINFMDAEEKTASENVSDENRFGASKEDEERRKQWQEGLEEGRKAAEQNRD